MECTAGSNSWRRSCSTLEKLIVINVAPAPTNCIPAADKLWMSLFCIPIHNMEAPTGTSLLRIDSITGDVSSVLAKSVRPQCSEFSSHTLCISTRYCPDVAFTRPSTLSTSCLFEFNFPEVTSSEPSCKSTSMPKTKCPAGAAGTLWIIDPVLQLNPTTSS